MTYSHQIESWFQKKGSFIEGLNLYRQVGGMYPISIFQGYETAPYVPEAVESRLVQALRDYLNKNPPAEGVAPQLQADETTATRIPGAAKAEPPKILELRQEARLLHKRHAFLHPQLKLVESDKQRYEIACEIMEEVIPKLDRIYDQIREWESTGELPKEDTSSIVQDTVRKMQRWTNLKSRISRVKGFLKKDNLEARTRQQYEKEIIEKEAEKRDIEEMLGL